MDKKGDQIIQWTEDTQTSLGSHKAGAELQTIEQLYDQCIALLLTKDNNNNHINLIFNKRGVIKQCQFTPKNCADDCSSGVNIQKLIFYKQ